MKIKLHGGDCCGAKHIHGLGYTPKASLAARAALSNAETSYNLGIAYSGARNDMRHANDQQDLDFFCDKAPKETAAARLSRFIRFLKKHRPHGFVEIITDNIQTKSWGPYLSRRGFVKVNPKPNKNSNTGAMLTMWVLYY